MSCTSPRREKDTEGAMPNRLMNRLNRKRGHLRSSLHSEKRAWQNSETSGVCGATAVSEGEIINEIVESGYDVGLCAA